MRKEHCLCLLSAGHAPPKRRLSHPLATFTRSCAAHGPETYSCARMIPPPTSSSLLAPPTDGPVTACLLRTDAQKPQRQPFLLDPYPAYLPFPYHPLPVYHRACFSGECSDEKCSLLFPFPRVSSSCGLWYQRHHDKR